MTSTRQDFQGEIDDVLSLNCPILVDGRERALDRYIAERFRGRSGAVQAASFVRWLDAIDGVQQGEQLPPHAGYLRWWLLRERKRRQR